MPSSFCILWSADRVQLAKRTGAAGQCIPCLFGGPHTSHPPISRYGISSGELVYPIGIRSRRIYVLCEAVIDRVMPIGDFLRDDSPDLTARRQARSTPWLCPTCTDEAALLRSATPLNFSRAIPPEALADIRFVNRSGDQRPLKLEADGKLKSSLSVQGHYLRLSDSTAELFRAVAHGELG